MMHVRVCVCEVDSTLGMLTIELNVDYNVFIYIIYYY